jgi:hypothetical protein
VLIPMMKTSCAKSRTEAQSDVFLLAATFGIESMQTVFFSVATLYIAHTNASPHLGGAQSGQQSLGEIPVDSLNQERLPSSPVFCCFVVTRSECILSSIDLRAEVTLTLLSLSSLAHLSITSPSARSLRSVARVYSDQGSRGILPHDTY